MTTSESRLLAALTNNVPSPSLLARDEPSAIVACFWPLPSGKGESIVCSTTFRCTSSKCLCKAVARDSKSVVDSNSDDSCPEWFWRASGCSRASETSNGTVSTSCGSGARPCFSRSSTVVCRRSHAGPEAEMRVSVETMHVTATHMHRSSSGAGVSPCDIRSSSGAGRIDRRELVIEQRSGYTSRLPASAQTLKIAANNGMRVSGSLAAAASAAMLHRTGRPCSARGGKAACMASASTTATCGFTSSKGIGAGPWTAHY